MQQALMVEQKVKYISRYIVSTYDLEILSSIAGRKDTVEITRK